MLWAWLNGGYAGRKYPRYTSWTDSSPRPAPVNGTSRAR